MSKYNKYQKALDILESACLPRATYDNPMPYGYGNEIKLLQELVNKATLEKPLFDRFYICPNCHTEIYWDTDYGQQHFDHCHCCGQALDWSKDE